MKAYNLQHIHNRTVCQQADRWHREGLLQPDQLAAIRVAYPVPFRESNTFSEIGTFIFTVIAVGGAYSLLALFLSGLLDSRFGFGLVNLLGGTAVLWLLHQLINTAHFYRNGPDNALIVMGATFLLVALNSWLPESTSFWVRCLLALPFLLFFTNYYGDVIIGFLTLMAFYAGLFAGLLEVPWGKTALPFVLMGVSFGLNWLVQRFQKWLPAQHRLYYVDVCQLAEWVTWVVLAAAGNYFVVRELNGLLLEVAPGEARPETSPPIALPALFWAFTFLIPAWYAYRGVTLKSRMYIILALLGLAAAASTVRYYYPLLPLPIHLTLVGTALIGGAVIVIRYLRRPRFGFTDVPDEDSPRQFFLNAETLSVLSATGSTLNRAPDLKFGGGNFGGGGAGREY